MNFQKKTAGNGRTKTGFSMLYTGSLLFFYLFFLILTSCASVPRPEKSTASNPQEKPEQSAPLFGQTDALAPSEWRQIAPGIYRYSQKTATGSVEFHAARIRLDEPGLRMVCTGPSDENPEEMRGETTAAFARRNKTAVAVNSSPFSLPGGYLSARRKISGLYIYDTVMLSPPASSYAALLFMSDGRAAVADSQTDTEVSAARYAFGGFWTILKNRQLQHFPRVIRDARTAAGVSEDGKTLYLLNVVKGMGSEGASFEETGKIMRFLGAYDAIMFDGGNSADLFFFEKSTAAKIFRPPVAANFGFYTISH